MLLELSHEYETDTVYYCYDTGDVFEFGIEELCPDCSTPQLRVKRDETGFFTSVLPIHDTTCPRKGK